MNKLIWLLAAGLMVGLMSGCEEEYVPFARKYAFPRIELPAQTVYKVFDQEACPFTFEYPETGTISRNQPDSCWVDISMEEFGATIHVNGRSIPGSGRPVEVHQEEHRRLIYNHSVKAARIVPGPLTLENGSGITYEMVGEVGTPMQAFFHDPSGEESVVISFYYQTAMKNDSLAPVTGYLKDQMNHLIESINWK